METRSDEIKAEMGSLDRLVARAVGLAESAEHPETAILWLDYKRQLEKRKASLRERLEREEAPLRKSQPQGVKIGGIDI